jgi:hypothetical protein
MLGVEPGAADLVVGEVEDLDLGEDRIRCELGGALGAEAPAAEVELPFTILVRSGIERLIEAGVTSPSGAVSTRSRPRSLGCRGALAARPLAIPDRCAR